VYKFSVLVLAVLGWANDKTAAAVRRSFSKKNPRTLDPTSVGGYLVLAL
jgi:hypothetical protein